MERPERGVFFWKEPNGAVLPAHRIVTFSGKSDIKPPPRDENTMNIYHQSAGALKQSV